MRPEELGKFDNILHIQTVQSSLLCFATDQLGAVIALLARIRKVFSSKLG
jgi:hypothetical protein